MYKFGEFGELATSDTLNAESEAAKQYTQALFSLIECLDLTTVEGVDRAHGILQHIAIIERMQATLKQPAFIDTAIRERIEQVLARLQKEPL